MFNECLFHLCGCTCSNVMCVCSTICGSNKKFFCFFFFFLFAFGSDLYHPCFSKFFKLFLCEKTCFLGVFMTHFICKLNWVLNGPNLMFFNFVQKVSRVAREQGLPAKNFASNFASQLPAKIPRSTF